MLEQLFAESIGFTLLFIILSIFALWLFIHSAVKSGTKSALNEFYNETIRHDEIKAIKEKEFKDEMDSWN